MAFEVAGQGLAHGKNLTKPGTVGRFSVSSGTGDNQQNSSKNLSQGMCLYIFTYLDGYVRVVNIQKMYQQCLVESFFTLIIICCLIP